MRYPFGMRIPILISLVALLGGAVAAEEPVAFVEDFDKVAVGEVPEDVMEIEGEFAVVEEAGEKFLRVGIEPLTENGIILGPSMKAGGRIEAKIRAYKKRRSYPRFGVGLHGISGYRLRVVPSGGTVELLRNEEVVASEKFEWKADVWTNLKLEIKAAGDAWSIRGWVWPVADGDQGKQPEKATIEHSDKEAPGQGKASVWGSPYSGRPIDFDEVKVVAE
jgi:hypothetical protein